MSKKKPEINENEVENEEIIKRQNELETLKSELEASNDRILRLAAEYDNFRRRTSKEKELSYCDAKASVIEKLLPVLDNFDRARINEASDLDSYKKGIEMTYNQFVSILSSLGVESFGEKGDAFDPSFHNAVMRAESDENQENTLAQVFLKGYKIGDRVLRCADVQVAN